MSRRCAICYNDPAISHWKNPDPENVKPRGTSESNWACDGCLGKDQNREWRNIPAEEVYGIETEFAGDTHARPDSAAGPFETATCIEIMRRYCLGEAQRDIAKTVGCQLSFVIKTIGYWRKERGYFLKTLKKSLSKKGRNVH